MNTTHETDDEIETVLREMIESGEIEVLHVIDGEPVLWMRAVAPEDA